MKKVQYSNYRTVMRIRKLKIQYSPILDLGMSAPPLATPLVCIGKTFKKQNYRYQDYNFLDLIAL